MIARVGDLYDKEVICLKDGTRLGLLSDVEINTVTGMADAIVVYSKRRIFGIFGGGDDIVIPWSCIEVFGEEIVLVNYDPPLKSHSNTRTFLSKLFD